MSLFRLVVVPTRAPADDWLSKVLAVAQDSPNCVNSAVLVQNASPWLRGEAAPAGVEVRVAAAGVQAEGCASWVLRAVQQAFSACAGLLSGFQVARGPGFDRERGELLPWLLATASMTLRVLTSRSTGFFFGALGQVQIVAPELQVVDMQGNIVDRVAPLNGGVGGLLGL